MVPRGSLIVAITLNDFLIRAITRTDLHYADGSTLTLILLISAIKLTDVP